MVGCAGDRAGGFRAVGRTAGGWLGGRAVDGRHGGRAVGQTAAERADGRQTVGQEISKLIFQLMEVLNLFIKVIQ